MSLAHLRILVTGSRDLADFDLVATGLDIAAELYGPDAEAATVVHGACRGADTLADRVARRNGWQREPYKVTGAEWKQIGPGAGPRRNKRMVDSGADVCVRFPGGDGTRNCAETAAAAGIPVMVIDRDPTGRTIMHYQNKKP